MDDPDPGKKKSVMKWLRKTFGLDDEPKEIQQVIDESEQAGLIDEDQGDMIEGICDLKQTVAREIMLPRTSYHRPAKGLDPRPGTLRDHRIRIVPAPCL